MKTPEFHYTKLFASWLSGALCVLVFVVASHPQSWNYWYLGMGAFAASFVMLAFAVTMNEWDCEDLQNPDKQEDHT